jgi:hypothetical protein
VSGESSLKGRKAPTATQDKQSDKVPQNTFPIAHAHTHGMDGVNFRETIERFVCDMVYSRAAYMFLSVGEHTGACKIHTRTHTHAHTMHTNHPMQVSYFIKAIQISPWNIQKWPLLHAFKQLRHGSVTWYPISDPLQVDTTYQKV